VSASEPPDSAFIDWGGDGPPLHLAHANGFPAASYRSLIGLLMPAFHVVSLEARPLWSNGDPEALHDWHPMAEDLRAGLRRHGLRGLVGVGHSLGGTLSALAAAAEPELFSALVLIDPVIFTWPRSWFWSAMQRLGLAGRFPLVRRARERRVHWSGRAAVRAAYRDRRVFAGWAPDAFEDYLDAGFVDAPGGGVRLRYTREWEARIFEVCPADVWRELARIPVPILFVRGEASDTFLGTAARRGVRQLADARTLEVAGSSHFLPFERPSEVARAIVRFAAEVRA
jgi:pimeloyl-ACP methyl ester carboxylesterase